MERTTGFDPKRHLSRINGAEYLEVKWRLVWLRDVHPDASIDTELISHEGESAVFRARVTVPGGGSATGWGSEQRGDFRDYLEKAETKALGRALAALGFGTQFCPDFDFGVSAGKVVDSPVRVARATPPIVSQQAELEERRVANINQPVTDRQIKFIRAIARERGLTEPAVLEEAARLFGVASLNDLDRRAASALIEALRELQPTEDLAS